MMSIQLYCKVFQKIYNALVPGGIAVHHRFSLQHQPYPEDEARLYRVVMVKPMNQSA
jgi:hypothetical protein